MERLMVPRMRSSRQAVAVTVAVCFTGATLIAPLPASAAPGQFTAQWIPYRISALTTVSYPRDSWQLLGEVARSYAGGFDIRMLQGERWITLAREEAGTLGLSSDQIREIMHAELATVTPETTTLDALKTMHEIGVGCLPVVEDDKLVGLVTETDLIEVAAELLERFLAA